MVGSGARNSPDADKRATGGEAEPNPCMVHVRNVVSRLCSSYEGSGPRGLPVVWPVQEEGRSEGRSVIDRIEVATSPHAKACRLPSGLWAREYLMNRPKEGKQMTTETTEVHASETPLLVRPPTCRWTGTRSTGVMLNGRFVGSKPVSRRQLRRASGTR